MRRSRIAHLRRDPLGRASRRRQPGGSRPFYAYAPTRLLGLALLVLASDRGLAAELAEEAGPARPSTTPHVEFRDGLLSIDARDVALEEVLKEIARQTGLAVSRQEPLPGRVTAELRRLGVPIAIHRLLRGKSFALRYAPSPTGAPLAASKLWIFASGEPGLEAPEGYEPEPPTSPEAVAGDDAAVLRLEAVAELADRDTPPSVAGLASAMADESASVRFEALYALGEVGGELSTQLLQQALVDPDARIRRAAVDALAEIGGERSASALAAVLSDPDPALREDAVYALGEIGGETAARALRRASTDPDEFVREATIDVLEEIDKRD